MHYISIFKKLGLFSFGDDILASTSMTRVKPENIIKLKHIMHWAITIPNTVRPCFLPYHAYPT